MSIPLMSGLDALNYMADEFNDRRYALVADNVSGQLLSAGTSVIEDLFKAQNEATFLCYERHLKHSITHIENSREMILSAAKSIDKTSRVIVMGPGKLEPLAELAAKCGELVLVNNDLFSLVRLAEELSMKNVIIKKMDFTSGLYDEMEKLMTSAVRESYGLQRFMGEIIQLFNNYNPASLLDDDDLRGADLVVSSLIATQFTVFAESRLQSFLKSQYKVTISAYLQNTSWGNASNYAVSENNLCNRLIVQYSKCLAKLIKPEGRIYWSDTFAQVTIAPLIAAPSALRHEAMSLNNLEEIEASYKVLESRNWYWLSQPSSSYGYQVKAYILSRK